ncbi:MAG TPA: glycogen debranching N-terminal domain-containing protein [Acidimicrobiales bacterium]|nr:glycogen debranching N-terminal domain-containing protein [Acidimicrobiales bacterium]
MSDPAGRPTAGRAAWPLLEGADPGGATTLVEGSSFAVCGPDGDMAPGEAHGLFVWDTRVISRWQLRLDDQPVDPLAGFTLEPYAGLIVGRARTRGSQASPGLLVERRRYVGGGLREDLTVRNYGPAAADVTLAMDVDADFADLFAVKGGGGTPPDHTRQVQASGDGLRLTYVRGRIKRGVRITADGATFEPHRVVFQAVVPAHGCWSGTILVLVSSDEVEAPARFPPDEPVEATPPAERLARWRREAPVVTSDQAWLPAVLERSETDVAALRISDPEQPEIAVVAAGAPWFMALFGRDSLVAGWMMLPFSSELTLGTLRTLARYQGRGIDPGTEEEPGRILHELRVGVTPDLALGGSRRYYGTADATPLFVMLLGEAARWGLDRAALEALLPAADAALEWIHRFGDRDGDGFVECRRATDRGLRNQGWKDSVDGVNFADGALAEPPVALAEVQAYVYGAYLARAELARLVGDEAGIRRWQQQAAGLRGAFDQAFWLPERGYYAVGLDADKQPIDALASNMGHCLWTGLAEESRVDTVARALAGPELFSGYGVRTLGASMGAYNPVSYHNGSVWPHDTALAVSGLIRYGRVQEGQRIAGGLFEAARHFGGRLPELFSGFDRSWYPAPVPYPTSCSPQAWAAATPVHLLRTLLRLDPDVPQGRIWLDPALPPSWEALRVRGIPIAGERLSVSVTGGEVRVEEAPPGLEVIRAPRPLPDLSG